MVVSIASGSTCNLFAGDRVPDTYFQSCCEDCVQRIHADFAGRGGMVFPGPPHNSCTGADTWPTWLAVVTQFRRQAGRGGAKKLPRQVVEPPSARAHFFETGEILFGYTCCRLEPPSAVWRSDWCPCPIHIGRSQRDCSRCDGVRGIDRKRRCAVHPRQFPTLCLFLVERWLHKKVCTAKDAVPQNSIKGSRGSMTASAV